MGFVLFEQHHQMMAAELGRVNSDLIRRYCPSMLRCSVLARRELGMWRERPRASLGNAIERGVRLPGKQVAQHGSLAGEGRILESQESIAQAIYVITHGGLSVRLQHLSFERPFEGLILPKHKGHVI